jgi:glycosyltransferase involved in cell wall biosynthesis
MRVIGMMRVKNEARWIARAVRSIQPLCDRVVVFDDNSTDGTPDIARGLGAYLWYQGGNGCDEARDKNFMLDLAIGYRADWVLMIDGDEELTAASVPVLREAMKGKHKSISMDVLYLWDDEQQVRTDGVYREFLRQSMFRPGSARFGEHKPPNFHCGNVPASIRFPYHRSEAQLLHYGYLDRADRVRKHAWYNAVDPHNGREDEYRHMIIGDTLPAETKRLHGGPLELRPLSEILRA